MAKLRKWCAYRTIERPYTRWSKVRGKAFVKSRPGKKVIKFDMGDLKGGKELFPLSLKLVSRELGNVRSNAIEAGRIVILKRLEAKLGRFGFYFRVGIVPHHVIRENPLAAGAGADRLSTGMKHSFGKTIATAAIVEARKAVYEIYLPVEHEALARNALKVASKKLPLRTAIVTELSKKAVKELTKEEILEHKLFSAKEDLKDAKKELENAKDKLKHAEKDEDKKKFEEQIKILEQKIHTSEHVIEVEKEEIEHLHEEEHKKGE